MNKTVIFVNSQAFSGSTFLSTVLSLSKNVFNVGELSALFRPTFLHHAQRIDCTCQEAQEKKEICLFWHPIRRSNVPERYIYRVVFSLTQKDFIVDSSKILSWFMDSHDWCVLDGYTVKNVLLFKHPVDFVYSHWKRRVRKGEVFSESDVESLMERWYRYYKHLLETEFEHYVVEYRSLIANFDEVVKGICEYVGLPAVSEGELRTDEKQHILYGNTRFIMQFYKKNFVIKRESGYEEEFLHWKRVADEIFVRRKNISDLYSYLLKLSSERPLIVGKRVIYPHPRPWWYYGNRARFYINKFRFGFMCD